jgi:tetratricopeptide (TPR) repeat protein
MSRVDNRSDAIRACTVLLAHDLSQSQRSKALSTRGYYLNEADDPDHALADFNEALWLEPNNAMAFAYRGLTFAGLKKYDLAIADFTRSIVLSPVSRTYDNRGRSYLAIRDYHNAIADFSRAIELEPELAKAWRHRGEAKAAMGDKEGAKQDMAKALKIRPGYKAAERSLNAVED